MIKGITFDEQTVTAENMAHLMKAFSGNVSGITRGCEITSDANNMYISEGYMLIQGREVQVIGTHSVSLNKVTAGEQYCRVVYEIDLSNSNTSDAFNQGAIKTLTLSSGYPTLTQQDLEDNPTGVYQFLLAQYHTSPSGIDSFTAKASSIDTSWMNEEAFKKHFSLKGTDLYITL